MVEILGPMPARPPTPPRRGSRIDQGHTESPSLVQTPGDSLDLADSPGAAPSSRGPKRVTFSPWPQSAVNAQPGKKSDSPFKSILKETSSSIPVWSPNVDRFTSESLAMLLESVIQQLAGESITARLDAYMQFFGALRSYEGLPTAKDIAEKLGIITDFIQRDVCRDLSDGTPIDINLTNQALKLSAVFTWNTDVSTHLTDEFRIFLVERAITCIHESKVPKSVVTHYMSILSAQNFSARIMTSARVARLLSVLQETTKYASGKTIGVLRLGIYQRLLSQTRSTFLAHESLWVEYLISGLLNPVKEVRMKSITLGFQISVSAGANHLLSKSIRDLFDRPLENDRKMATEIRERMSRMMASPDSGVHVPQVWSVIVLLLRSKKWKLSRWDHFKDWVLILQKCLNCSEPAIKAQAILGWNRFVFAVGPDENTGRVMLNMLGKPVLSQFERKKFEKCGPSTAQLALGSYYNLLYYAFRPSPSHQHLDLIWEEYITFPSTTMFSTLPILSDNASRVLTNLLWSSQTKIWSENRISDSSKIEPQELPSIDFRWVRSRVPAVLKVFESLLKSSVWDDNELERSNIALAWSSLSNAISMASSKEITPSGESMQAVASVLGFLRRLWAIGPSSVNAMGEDNANTFLERFRFLSATMIASLGGMFTEKLLLRVGDETLQTSNIPTHRPSSPETDSDSPILHLLRTVMTNPIVTTATLTYNNLIVELIESSCKSRISRGSRLELLHQCAALSASRSDNSQGSSLSSGLVWKASARAAADALLSFPTESARERDGSVSSDYDNVIRVLRSGLHFIDMTQEWSLLLEAFVRVVRTEKGDLMLAGLIIEPIAQSLLSLSVKEAYGPLVSLLTHSRVIPFMQDTGAENGLTVDDEMLSPSFPSQLVAITGRTLRLAYENFSPSELYGLAGFVDSLASFLGSGVPSFRSRVLECLQSSLCCWVKDENTRLDTKQGVDNSMLNACRALLSAILDIMQASVVDDLSEIHKFEAIICAGLESIHASIVRKFVDFWNSTAASQDETSCKTAIGESLRTGQNTLQTSIATSQDLQENIISFPAADHSLNPHVEDPFTSKPMVSVQDCRPPNSSSVIDTNDAMDIDPLESAEPQLPSRSQPHSIGAQINQVSSTVDSQANRRDMFRMLDSIRSSSPATTPGRVGFDTPLQLRRIQSSTSNVEIPLTPTLAPTENDDGFIGSSPTPATRDPTPAMHSSFSMSVSHHIPMNDALDPPSSPPENNSHTPSPQKRSKRSRSERRRSAKARKALGLNSPASQTLVNKPAPSCTGNDAPETSKSIHEDVAQTNTPQTDERPPSRRTRSALSQGTGNEQKAALPSTPDIPRTSNENVVSQQPKAKSSSKKKKKKSSKSANIEAPQLDYQRDVPVAPANTEYLDSSSDDLETQIASQLEQDLELAVDMSGSTQGRKPVEEPETSQGTKKRKRVEDDDPAPGVKETRRSTRLSTSKDYAPSEDDRREAKFVNDGEISEAMQNTILGDTTSSAPRRSTRSSQPKGDDLVVEKLPSQPHTLEASEGSKQEQEVSRRSSKRSRKSLRAESRSALATVDESNTQSRSTNHTHSRNTRSSEPQSLPPTHTEDSQLATATNEVDKSSLPLEMSAKQSLSPVQEVTADAPHIPAQPDSIITKSHHITEQAEKTTHTSTEMQTHTPLQSEPNISSESGITNSLKKILGDMKLATLSLEALREVDDILFNIRVEAHDASRRYNPSA